MTATALAHEEPTTLNGVNSTTLSGRFMMPDMSEHQCMIIKLAVTGATFLTKSAIPAGNSIVAYIDDLGRVEAIAGEAVDGGFDVLFDVKGGRLEKLETRIKWLNRRQNGSTPRRRHPRLEPRDSKSQITLPDGRVYYCEILDISLSGAGIKVDVMPAIDTYIMVGKMRARIVRHLDNGIGVVFVKPPAASEPLFDH